MDRRGFLLSTGALTVGAFAKISFAAQASDRFTLMAVGDIILDAPNPDSYFDLVRATLKTADLAVGQVEIPHTLRPIWSNGEPHSAPAADPAHLPALARAGFTVATLSGNHLFDQGAPGVEDTIKALREAGLQTVGAGMNLAEARKPAVVRKRQLAVAVLQYNAVGPQESWAAPLKAGGAFVRVETHYVRDNAEPGGMPTTIYTIVDPATLQKMEKDIAAARELADVVVVGFHIGRAGVPELLQYQTELTHRAIDAGAQMVFGSHTHSLLGVEIYRGKPIYHGLGNFVTVTGSIKPTAPNAVQRSYRPFDHPSTRPAVRFNAFTRTPEEGPPPHEYYPFTEVSRNTMIAKAVFGKDGVLESSFIPCFIDDQARPVPLARGQGGEKVVQHVEALTRGAGLPTVFDWNAQGTEVIVRGA